MRKDVTQSLFRFSLRDRCFARCKLVRLSEKKRENSMTRSFLRQEAFFDKKFFFFDSAPITKAIILKEDIITERNEFLFNHFETSYASILTSWVFFLNWGLRKLIYLCKIIDKNWKCFVISMINSAEQNDE